MVTQAYVRRYDDPIGSFIFRLAEEMESLGVQVVAVAPHASGLSEREIIGRTPVVRFRYAPRDYERLAYSGNMSGLVRSNDLNKLLLPAFLAGFVATTIAAVRAQHSDVIHAHWWFPSGVVGAAASALTGVPLVVTCHGTDVGLLGRSALVDSMAQRVFRRAAALSAVSSYLRDAVCMRFPSLHGRVAITPMPVARVFTEARGCHRHSHAGRKVILAVGRLSRQKGFDSLVIASRLLRDRGLDAVVRIAGAGEDESALKDLANALGVHDRIDFLGMKTPDELATLYASSDVVALPSYEEGLGLALIEAMFCGTPVIGSTDGGASDVVTDGRTGLLVRPGDATVLAGALERLLTDATLAQRLGRAGQQFVKQAYDPVRSARSMIDVYGQALSSGI
jgi:glycosyltransferase involved in cell wall biosynthesis